MATDVTSGRSVDGDKNTSEATYNIPVILKDRLKSWEPLGWSLDDWKLKLNKPRLAVRTGERQPQFKHPQWERFTKSKTVSCEDFFGTSGSDTDSAGEWMYFDYKYMREIFYEDVLKQFDWGVVGLKDRDGIDSTLWIGSKGAHTPCHQDTYGYNLVAQLYGSKSWILVSPEYSQMMLPSRVPYEESSIYSKINFNDLTSNSAEVLEMLSKVPVHTVDLEPGDVLYVPRQWWHFVQNQTFAISVNTWVECPEDDEARLEEALVRLQAATFAKSLPREEAKLLLNPNEDDLLDADLSQLSDLTFDVAKQLTRPSTIERKLPKFGDAAVSLNPRFLDVPTPAVEPTAVISTADLYNSAAFGLFNVMTSPSVVSTAAAKLKSEVG